MIQIFRNIFKGDYTIMKNKVELINNSINTIIIFCDIDKDVISLCDKLDIKIIKHNFDENVVSVLINFICKMDYNKKVFIHDDEYGKQLIDHLYKYKIFIDQ